jgi:PKD repeat protein
MTQIITSTKKILANLAIASFVLTVVAPVVAIAAGPATITFVAPAANASFKVNQVVNFQTTVTGGTAPYQYSWNFGDGKHLF